LYRSIVTPPLGNSPKPTYNICGPGPGAVPNYVMDGGDRMVSGDSWTFADNGGTGGGA